MPSIHHEITLAAPPARIYRALLDAKEHAAFTGAPAEIDATPGGAFTLHGGSVRGHTLELVPDARIVQAWRFGHWPEGRFSIVRFELVPDGDRTKLVLDHDGVPEENVPLIDSGWKARYWEPLRAYLEG